jgi:glyoxylase-like metal-dependent hydrolase (beta-lactamase superfamily II)
MTIKFFEFNPFAENTYILHDETGEAAIVDPGCYEDREKEELVTYISQNNLNVTQLINTHCHIDHVLGNQFVKDKYKVELKIHKNDQPVLLAVKTYAPNYGFVKYQEAEADEFIDENSKVNFGETSLEVLFLPGHAPGHIALVHHESKSVINGDVLFLNSIGRTDLPGGDHDTLIRSIQNVLFKLPDDYTVYCGHGPATNIGYEKRTNPFCRLT